MDDDDKPVDVAIRPVLPSRAGLEPPNVPAFLDQPSPGTEPKPRRRRLPLLPPDEIERINTNRKENMKKRKAKKYVPLAERVSHKPARAKNPNRPLELKNRMLALVGAVGSLEAADLKSFTEAVVLLNDLPKPGRQRVLDALAKVYG
jgi:hypothetical protein